MPVNSNINKGTMTISLNDGIPKEYVSGNILNIPFNTKMNVKNLHDEDS